MVKGMNFEKSRILGPIMPSMRIYQSRDVDELVVLDVTRKALPIGTPERFIWIEDVNKFSTMPLAVGGGISSIEQVTYLIQNGVDKVVINSALHEDSDLIRLSAGRHGVQSIVASVDAYWKDGNWMVFNSWANEVTSLSVKDVLASSVLENIGELMLTSWHKEGQMKGYDIDLLDLIPRDLSIPLIFNGGAGKLEDFSNILINGRERGLQIDALAASSCFFFKQLTPCEVSIHLKEKGFWAR